MVSNRHSSLLLDVSHLFGRYNITPERVWSTLHGFIGLGFAIWWQATVQLAAAMRNQMMKAQ